MVLISFFYAHIFRVLFVVFFDLIFCYKQYPLFLLLHKDGNAKIRSNCDNLKSTCLPL